MRSNGFWADISEGVSLNRGPRMLGVPFKFKGVHHFEKLPNECTVTHLWKGFLRHFVGPFFLSFFLSFFLFVQVEIKRHTLKRQHLAMGTVNLKNSGTLCMSRNHALIQSRTEEHCSLRMALGDYW